MNERILIVDDDESMQFFLKEAMMKRGYEPTVVGDAEAAINAVKENASFDLVALLPRERVARCWPTWQPGSHPPTGSAPPLPHPDPIPPLPVPASPHPQS